MSEARADQIRRNSKWYEKHGIDWRVLADAEEAMSISKEGEEV